MKITFAMPVVKQNGGCRVVAIHAKKLLAMGHDVTVVSRQPAERHFFRQIIDRLKRSPKTKIDPNRTDYFDDLGERHVQIPWKWPLDASDVPDADVIIATWWRTAFEVAALPPEKGAKVYFVQGHEVHDTQPRDLAGGSYHLPLGKITVSSHLADIMAELYGDFDVDLVPNSVDTDQFDAPPRDKATRPTVGFLYSGAAFKNTQLALDAIKGSGVSAQRVVAFGARDILPHLPLPAGTHFRKLPPQAEIPRLYAMCDVWLMPSDSEGFGLPTLEAMACRTPVISTCTGAAADLIEDGVQGYVVDINDTAAMSARLAEVLHASAEDWRAMSDAAYVRAHSYTWDDAALAFEAALNKASEKYVR